MTITLPPPVASYFAADRANPVAVAACFTHDAIVKDEGRTHRGTSEIMAWKADTANKYTYTSPPVAIAEEDGKTVVTCHHVGDFPGGEVDLRHIFGIEGDKIAYLHITV